MTSLIDPTTGEVIAVEAFVAGPLGLERYLRPGAGHQPVLDWIAGLRRFGGVTDALVLGWI